MESKKTWRSEITSDKNRFQLNLREIYAYRDLLMLFVRRDIVSVYKQTILGPLWYFISPLLSSFTQYWIFGRIAHFPSDGAPYFLFVLCGNVLWSYFQTSLMGTSNTFTANQGIFGKVYFPRAIVPISITASNLFQLGVKIVLLLVFIIIFGRLGSVTLWVLFLPVLIFIMAMLSMGFGMIISSMTTKYRDLTQLMSFAVGLVMYITPVIYPTTMLLEQISTKRYWIVYINPLTSVFDVFRLAFLGAGQVNIYGLVYSLFVSVAVYVGGLYVFNRVENTFMDTI